MRRAWLRGGENLRKRYLVHVAGYNLGLVMRLLVGAGTPREFLARAAAHLLALATTDGAVLVVLVVVIGAEAAILVVSVQPEPPDGSRASSTRCYGSPDYSPRQRSAGVVLYASWRGPPLASRTARNLTRASREAPWPPAGRERRGPRRSGRTPGREGRAPPPARPAPPAAAPARSHPAAPRTPRPASGRHRPPPAGSSPRPRRSGRARAGAAPRGVGASSRRTTAPRSRRRPRAPAPPAPGPRRGATPA